MSGPSPGAAAASDLLRYEPLAACHIDELATLLCNAEVYRHLGGQPPTREAFCQGLRHAMAGPPASGTAGPQAQEQWLNWVVRDTASGQCIGQLQATVHGAVAEVAFLYGPAHWGRGLATQGLQWLHQRLLASPDALQCWATTVPGNLPCQALLQRCGYVQVDPSLAPRLLSYDPGDLVFQGPGHRGTRAP